MTDNEIIKQAKAAAVKEFANILKAHIIFNFVRTKRIVKLIDNLVKEYTESRGNNGKIN